MIAKYGEDLDQHRTGDVDCWHGSTGEGQQQYGVNACLLPALVRGDSTTNRRSGRTKNGGEATKNGGGDATQNVGIFLTSLRTIPAILVDSLVAFVSDYQNFFWI